MYLYIYIYICIYIYIHIYFAFFIEFYNSDNIFSNHRFCDQLAETLISEMRLLYFRCCYCYR